MIVLSIPNGTIVIETRDSEVVRTLKSRGHYDLFMEQLKRGRERFQNRRKLKGQKGGRALLSFDYEDAVIFYQYNFDFSNNDDNGWLMVVCSPTAPAEVLETIRDGLAEFDVSSAELLWVDAADRRN